MGQKYGYNIKVNQEKGSIDPNFNSDSSQFTIDLLSDLKGSNIVLNVDVHGISNKSIERVLKTQNVNIIIAGTSEAGYEFSKTAQLLKQKFDIDLHVNTPGYAANKGRTITSKVQDEARVCAVQLEISKSERSKARMPDVIHAFIQSFLSENQGCL